MNILAIDPGYAGAFVLFDGKNFQCSPMPLIRDGKDKAVDFQSVLTFLTLMKDKVGIHVYLERAMSMGMGSTGAFNYGRGFATIEIAIQLSNIPVTYVEPGKWTKVMHEGISKDLKPKAKSIIAVKRLYPQLIKHIPKGPKSGKMDEGVVDALLIAGFGLRQLGVSAEQGKRVVGASPLLQAPYGKLSKQSKKRDFTDEF